MKKNSTNKEPKDRMKELTEQLENGVKGIFESENYKKYLKVMAVFHNYSVRNSILIMLQCPDATLVTGFNTWKNKLNRQVKKGEKAIWILAPQTVKRKMEKTKKDPVTGAVLYDENGEPMTECVACETVLYRAVPVFDISQTEGEGLPKLGVDELAGDVDGYKRLTDCLMKTTDFPVIYNNIEGGAKGYCAYGPEKKIVIQTGMSELQTVKTLIHEIAHSKLHDHTKIPKEDLPARDERELEAESVAYVVSQYLCLPDVSDYSFGYIASWSMGKDVKVLSAHLGKIRRCANEIITEVEKLLCTSQENAELAA